MQPENQPAVSVIIIVFNGAKYILDAINSVFSQSFKDWEIVVVDDGSTDNTKVVLEELIKEDKVRYFYQQNKGPSGAYNTGINQAKGKYIKFLDCDDTLYPKQLELQVEHLKNKSELIISFTNYELEFGGKNKKVVNLQLNKDQLAQSIKDNLCPGHTILIARSLLEKLGGYDEELFAHEDHDLWLRALLFGGHFDKLDYVGCCYRILGGSVSSDTNKMFQQRAKFYEKLNRILLPRFSQISDEALRQLLLSNFDLIHKCFVKKIDPCSCMPTILSASGKLYTMKRSGLRKLLLKFVGIKNIAFLSYLKLCLKDRNYKKSLLGVAWRNENVYE